MTTAQDIVVAIGDGSVDEHLDGIIAAAHERKRQQGRGKFHLAKIGDTGRLVNVRPKYLVGAPFTIVDKNQTRVVVTIDPDWLDRHPQAKGRWAGRVNCPPELLDLDEAS